MKTPHHPNTMKEVNESNTARTTPDLDLAAIKARADAATEGPWKSKPIRFHDSRGFTENCNWREIEGVETWDGSTPLNYSPKPYYIALPDATFIAHARTDIPALLTALASKTAEVEAVRKERDDVKSELAIVMPILSDLRWHANAICAISGTGEHDITKTVANIIVERDTLRTELETMRRERDEAVAKQPINTSLRLFDLVRFMRSELLEKELIDEDEYSWLCYGSEMAIDTKKGGSPSRARLEEYDQLRTSLASAERDKARLESACRRIAKDVLKVGLAETVGDCIKVARHIEALANGATNQTAALAAETKGEGR